METTPTWELIDKLNGYFFWKYTDKNGKAIYNATTTNTPPSNGAGYYDYGYILRVKGITPWIYRQAHPEG